MNEHRPTSPLSDDDLGARVAAALRSREPSPAMTSRTTERIARQLAQQEDSGQGRTGTAARTSDVVLLRRRVGTMAGAGLAAAGLGVAGATAAAAVDPGASFSRSVASAYRSVGISLPGAITQEQYDAYFAAGYTTRDQEALADLWHLDPIPLKAKVGQMLLDDDEVPVTPGSHPEPETEAPDEPWEALSASGYLPADYERLAELWRTDTTEAKARAGQMLLDGQELPVEPSGIPQEGYEQAAADEFVAEGYTEDDLAALAELWHAEDLSRVKVYAGQKLMNGETLPVSPSGISSTRD